MSGLANAGALAIINRATTTMRGAPSIRDAALFATVIVLYVVCLRYSFRATSELFTMVVHRVRVRLVDKIRRTDLLAHEHLGRGALYNNLVQELEIVSQSQMWVVAAMQSMLMLLATTFYMASLSIPGFVVSMITVITASVYYLYRQKEARRAMDRTSDLTIGYVDQLNHVLDGFKEIKLSRARSGEIHSDLEHASDDVRTAAVATASINHDLFIFSQCYFYFLMAIIVFVLPRFAPTDAKSITELTATVLFMVGPLGALVATIPLVSRANVAAAHVLELEAKLDENRTTDDDHHLAADYRRFERIVCERMEFSYREPDGAPLFTVGPIDLTIEQGRTLFIVGGNGSGKSSLLKLITALYLPDGGTLRLDREIITRENSQDYRELFSAVFSDFHLFTKLYGIGRVDERKVQEFLEVMALADKTRYLGDRFSHTDLSTGQRKRLALLITYLEDRPIYVFDEWAADQDPEFRQHFYTVMLRELKERGKTVIAASHDDRYFHVADRVVKMEYGRIVADLTPERR